MPVLEHASLVPSKPRRILHIVGAMNRGGVQTMIMNYYRKVDRGICQFDFVTMLPVEHAYGREIERLGGRVYYVPSPAPRTLLRHLVSLVRVMRQHGPYHAVHCHTAHHCGLVMAAAAMAGVPVRVSHSHTTRHCSAWLSRRQVYVLGMRVLIRLFANRFVACSQPAGVSLFGKRLTRSGKVKILRNALDLAAYSDIGFRDRITLREELGIPENSLVLGHVGSLTTAKNHSFLIRMFRELLTNKCDAYLVLAGEGPLRSRIEAEANASGTGDRIRFLGVRSDIPKLMKSIDLIVFPSLYEGLGLVLIEAQAAGTPCLVSTNVPQEADVGLGLMHFVDLSLGPQTWASAALSLVDVARPDHERVLECMRDRGYDVCTQVSNLMGVYGLG